VERGIERRGSPEDEYKFQDKELLTALALYQYDFGARYYDPQLGRWHTPDPADQFGSPYLAMGNNPVMGVDPDGRFVHLLVGAVIGGAINLVMNINNIHSLGDGLAYFGVGAAAGALGAGVGAGVSSALAGGSFGAGFVGSQAALTATSSFVSGAAIGGAGGFAGGFANGLGNGLVNGESFGSALQKGAMEGLIGGVTGGLIGGVAGGIRAAKDGRYFWTGEQQRLVDNVNLPMQYVEQKGTYDCAYACMESIDNHYGGTRTQADFKALMAGASEGVSPQTLITKAGYKVNVALSPDAQTVAASMKAGTPAIVAKSTSEAGMRHAVIPSRIQIIERGVGARMRIIYKAWAMDPMKRYSSSTLRGQSRNPFKGNYIFVPIR